MTLISTDPSSILVPNGGTARLLDGVTYTDLRVFSIVPEDDVTVSVLTGYGTTGTDGGIIDFKTTRRLTALKAGVIYFAGANSWFANITVTGGNITVNS